MGARGSCCRLLRMDEWQRYVAMRSLRAQWEDRIASFRQRLRNGDIDSPEGQLLKQELAIYEAILHEFVTRLGLDERR